MVENVKEPSYKGRMDQHALELRLCPVDLKHFVGDFLGLHWGLGEDFCLFLELFLSSEKDIPGFWNSSVKESRSLSASSGDIKVRFSPSGD